MPLDANKGPPGAGDRLHPFTSGALNVLAAAACLARHADGGYMIPTAAAIALQAPAALYHGCLLIHRLCARGARAFRIAVDSVLFILVLVGGVGIAVIHRNPDAIFASVTGYIVIAWIVDRFVRLLAATDRAIASPRALLGIILRSWLVLIPLVTVILSLPLSTLSSVPDYRHNFWLHVCNCAFSATGAATLTGLSIYSFGEEFSFFGQMVLFLTTQASGALLAAAGLAVVRPFLGRPPALRTVLVGAVLLQLIAAGIMWPNWSDADAPTVGARAWWGLVHAGSAIWNAGWTLRTDGLASYFSNPSIVGVVSVLSVLGSIGLPILLDLLGGVRASRPPLSGNVARPIASAGQAGSPAHVRTPPPWKKLAHWEAAATLVLLVVSAGLIFVWETPRFLPTALTPTRPVDFGEGRVSLRDDMPHAVRWTMSVFAAATVRSSGLQSMPVSEGAISWPSYVLIVGLMVLGGSAAGTAGGLRVTTLVLIAMGLLASRLAWASHPDGAGARRMFVRGCAKFMVIWLATVVAVVGGLFLCTDGTAYERVFEAAAVMGNVGLSTGLSLHLTWLGRLVMIVAMIVGRVLPLWFWVSLSDRFIRLTAAVDPIGRSVSTKHPQSLAQ